MIKDAKRRYPRNPLWGDGWEWALFKGDAARYGLSEGLFRVPPARARQRLRLRQELSGADTRMNREQVGSQQAIDRFRTKRIYERPDPSDRTRILVDSAYRLALTSKLHRDLLGVLSRRTKNLAHLSQQVAREEWLRKEGQTLLETGTDHHILGIAAGVKHTDLRTIDA